MKTLMIAAAIVCAAAMSQATTISWGAGDAMQGFVGSEVAEMQEGGDYLGAGSYGYLFVMGIGTEGAVAQAAADWAMLTSAEDIWGAFDASANTLTVNGHTYNGEKVQFDSSEALFWSDGSANKGDNVYAAIVLTSQDLVTGDDIYSANTFHDVMGESGLQSALSGAASLQWVDGVAGEATTWQSVPEPTSGLLLLLGVAGLALKRKRA